MNYVFPSDQDRADNDQLNEACEYIEYLLQQEAITDFYSSNRRSGYTNCSEAVQSAEPIGFPDALKRAKAVFAAYREDFPRFGKRLDGTPAYIPEAGDPKITGGLR